LEICSIFIEIIGQLGGKVLINAVPGQVESARERRLGLVRFGDYTGKWTVATSYNEPADSG